jgi:hypothetical protein
MAQLTVRIPAAAAGVVSTLVAAAGGGDQFANTGSERFRVRNNDASAKTVTIVAQNADGCPSNTPHNLVLTVAAGEERVVKNLRPERFNDVNGNVQITYSAVTSVFVGVEAQ